jgi:hypothetical protein
VLSRCARGRDRIRERSGEDGYLFGNKLAHADLNALATLDNDGWTRSHAPCTRPRSLARSVCVVLRMSDVGAVRYAAKEPWGGSAAMFETVP